MTTLIILICLLLFIVSGYLITYNVEIISVQKTPIQQNWLSIGLSFQLMLPVLFLIFRNEPTVKFLAAKYFSLLTMAYFHLHITKFNVQIPKHFIKSNLMLINVFVAYLVMCMIVSVLRYKYTEDIAGPFVTGLFKKEDIITSIFLIYSIVAISMSLCIDFFKVRRTVNALKICNIVYELFLVIFLLFGHGTYACFFFMVFSVIIIENFLIKIICIDKGRYYYDR